MVARAPFWVFALLTGSGFGSGGCADPVHDQKVHALGREDPSVPEGPLHRPGQPCLACHDASGPASSRFSLGGTVYAVVGQKRPAVGAVVQIQDILGRPFSATTNQAGNFVVRPDDFTPQYPIQMSVSSADRMITQTMLSVSARSGSCADCHTDTASSNSPGPVYLSANDPPAQLEGGIE